MAGEARSQELWSSRAVKSPSVQQLKEVSEQLKLQCTDQELDDFKSYIDDELLGSYQRLDRLVAPSLPVKYPRTPGHPPEPEENKNNAWYWKCDITGAPEGKLRGKRVGIKDNVCVAGVPMMNGSRLLEGYVPDIDATVVTRILEAGGRIVGKTNCCHFCLSVSSWTNDTGPITNPHNALHGAGGSSGGSAVALVNGEIDMAIGADQGGSIRVPASHCGIVGLKPTWGLVPYTGAIPIEVTVDFLGPMTNSVMDCALLLEVIAGYDGGLDPRQPSNLAVPEYTKQLTGNLEGKKVAILKEGFTGCDVDVADYVKRAALTLSGAGATLEEISIPIHADGQAIWTPLCIEGCYRCMVQGNGNSYHWKGYYSLSLQEALRKGFQSNPQGFSDVMKLDCIFSEYIAKEHQNKFYAKAQNMNLVLTKAYNEALEKYDVIVLPTTLRKASPLPLKESTMLDRLKDATGSYRNCGPFNATGHPALTISVGKSDGLPIGMSIVGRHFDETSVLQVAYAYEKLRDGSRN